MSEKLIVVLRQTCNLSAI